MDNDRPRAEGPTEPTSYPLSPPAEPADSAAAAAVLPKQGVPARPARPAGEDPRAGRLLGGRYRLTGRLGHGGMGTVWHAHDEVVDRDVAVKEPRLPSGVEGRHRDMLYERMRREARAAARIEHPNVVTVHDVVTEDGQPWLVMELVRGESLAEVLESGTLGVREAARIGLAVTEALAAAHAAGVVHRDVKPANVLLGPHDRVILTDFGIAQVEGEQGLTDTGVFLGSAQFSAPERVLGQRPGPASDLWSLGVTLYTAVEGYSPFRRSTPPATAQAVLSAEPQSPSRAAGPLGDLIMRLLAKNPADRPGVDETRRTLRSRATAPEPSPAPGSPRTGPAGAAVPPERTLRLRTLPRGRRGRAVLAATLAAAVLAASALLVTGHLGGSGSGLPEGWRVHKENDLRLEIAVPRSFERVTDPENSSYVGYESADGIYTVNVWSWEDQDSALSEASDNFGSIKGSYEYSSVDGDFYEREFQGEEAAERWVRTHPNHVYDESQDHLTYRVALFYASAASDRMWEVEVVAPGEQGNARQYGEELYDEILGHLTFREGTGQGAGAG